MRALPGWSRLFMSPNGVTPLLHILPHSLKQDPMMSVAHLPGGRARGCESEWQGTAGKASTAHTGADRSLTLNKGVQFFWMHPVLQETYCLQSRWSSVCRPPGMSPINPIRQAFPLCRGAHRLSLGWNRSHEAPVTEGAARSSCSSAGVAGLEAVGPWTTDFNVQWKQKA